MSVIINQAVMRSEDQVINLNTKSQLSNRGIGSDGTPLTPPYRPRTIEMKKRKGQTTAFVTTRDTGEWHDNFEIIYKSNQIEFTARPTFHQGVNVTQYLQKRYGNKLFGLVDFNITKLQQIILPSILQQLRNG